jgi:hypothetical protein
MRFQHNALGLLCGGLLSMIASPAVAQNAAGFGTPFVPIHGHTGIIQEPINTAEMYEGVNRIAVAIDLAAKRNAKVYKMEAVGNIERGMPVTVQYAPTDDNPATGADEIGPNGVATVEGKVTSVDRVHGRIGVKYSDGRMETLRVTEHVAPNSGTLEVKGRRVIVVTSNKAGQQVVQYFKRKS